MWRVSYAKFTLGCSLSAFQKVRKHYLRKPQMLFDSVMAKIYFSGCEDIVHELEESLLFDLVVCEDESHSNSLEPCHAVEHLQVIQEIALVVGTGMHAYMQARGYDTG